MPDPAPHPLHVAVVLLAAGEGRRVGAAGNKVLLPLRGMPILAWSLRVVADLEHIDRVVVVIREQDRHVVEEAVDRHLPSPARELTIAVGGATRHESERNALVALAPAIRAGTLDVVAIHDTARPLADRQLFDAVIRTAHEHGGGVPVRPQPAAVSRDPRAALRHGSGLVGVQTPQAFRARPLLDAHVSAESEGFTATDTAGCVAAYTDLEVRAVPSSATNLKITHLDDLALAERLVRAP